MSKISRVRIVESQSFDTCVNLAFEEYFLNTVGDNELILFWWQSDHSVVIGRNQNPYQECNTQRLKEDKVRLVRRLSGGGAVYHDLGNLNFAFISKDDVFDTNLHFDIVLDGLSRLDINGKFSGRNDLITEGRKFSGNAFIHEEDRHLHHGTLLINANLSKVNDYLTVDHKKLDTKGFDSVRSRVINLNEIQPDITIKKIKESVKTSISNILKCNIQDQNLSDIQSKESSVYLDKYYSDVWNYGNTPDFSHSCKARYDWGSIQIDFSIEDGSIKEVAVTSDAMSPIPFQNLEKHLENKRFLSDVVMESLRNCEFEKNQIADVYRLIAESFFR